MGYPNPGRTEKASRVAVAALLVAHGGLIGWAAVRSSPTVDEVAHLPAGVAVWKYGRFDLYAVNPPLVKALAALPVVLAGAETDWRGYARDGRPEWEIGGRFIAANGERAFWYFTVARWACLPLSLIGGYVCYRWAGELYGRASGLLALTLWCFSPTVLAYGSLITPDLGAAALGVAAAYLFWRWLERPGWSRAVAGGLALGLAELTKMTWLVAFGLWPALWLAWRASERPPTGGARRQAGQILTILLLALYVLNLGCGFQGSFRKLGRYSFVTRTLGGVSADGPAVGNRFAGGWAGEVFVPLPEPYVRGLDLQKYDFERGKLSYLRGEFRHGGWWYFYLYALAVKEPLGTWVLVALAAGLSILSGPYSAGWRREAVVLAPGVAVLVLVSSQTGFSRYVRYVLPSLPFTFIWASKVARSVPLGHRGCAWATGGAVAWMIGSSLSVYPYSLSYFNELAGGPAGGHEHLIDASVDWGQDMFDLKRWYDRHPEARPFYVDPFGIVPPERFGIRPDPRPERPEAGWYAVSVHRLHEDERNRPLLRLRPVGGAGYSIRIYHLTSEGAARMRAARPPGPDPGAERGGGSGVSPRTGSH